MKQPKPSRQTEDVPRRCLQRVVRRRTCSCQLCRLSRCLSRIAKKCTPSERAALDVLWWRMESAETDMDWLCAKAQDGEELELGGRIYKPSNSELNKPSSFK